MPNSLRFLYSREPSVSWSTRKYGQGRGEDRRVECVRSHDKELRRYLLKPENWALYVPRVVDRIAAAVESLDGVALVDGSSPAEISHDGERSNLVAELGDLLYHVNDLMCVPICWTVETNLIRYEDENGVASKTEPRTLE